MMNTNQIECSEPSHPPIVYTLQQTRALEKDLPESWKLAIANKIENNLLSKIPFLSSLADMGEIRTLFSAELLMNSETKYFPAGTIIADSKEKANGIFVITSGQVSAELPIDSDEADKEKTEAKKCHAQPNPVLYVFGRGYANVHYTLPLICYRSVCLYQSH
jgi:hypothetical protein